VASTVSKKLQGNSYKRGAALELWDLSQEGGDTRQGETKRRRGITALVDVSLLSPPEAALDLQAHCEYMEMGPLMRPVQKANISQQKQALPSRDPLQRVEMEAVCLHYLRLLK
jgi:hypothetical protein